MIFATAANEPTMMLFLSEADVVSMREGRTKFVDERATKGAKFNKVVLALSATDEASVALLKGVIPNSGKPVRHLPQGNEVQCKACDSIMQPGELFEEKCIVCWATEAKRLSDNHPQGT